MDNRNIIGTFQKKRKKENKINLASSKFQWLLQKKHRGSGRTPRYIEYQKLKGK